MQTAISEMASSKSILKTVVRVLKVNSLTATKQERKYYLANGELKAIGNYVNDKMDGVWKWYRENGNLMQMGAFDHEKKTGTWKIIQTVNYMMKGNTSMKRRLVSGRPMTQMEN